MDSKLKTPHKLLQSECHTAVSELPNQLPAEELSPMMHQLNEPGKTAAINSQESSTTQKSIPDYSKQYPLAAYDCSTPTNIRDKRFEITHECHKKETKPEPETQHFHILHRETKERFKGYSCKVIFYISI